MAPDPFADMMLDLHDDLRTQEACGCHVTPLPADRVSVKIVTRIGVVVDPGDLSRVEVYDRNENHLRTIRGEDFAGEEEFTLFDANFLDRDYESRALALVVGE